MMFPFARAASAILLPLSLMACDTVAEKASEAVVEKALEKAIEAKTGGEVTIDQEGEGVVVKSKDGKGEIRLGGAADKVPEGWPSDVPAFPDAKVVMSMKLPKGWTLTQQTTATPDEVIAFYEKKLSGMKRQMTTDVGEARTLVMAGESKHVTVAATRSTKGKNAGQTMLNLLVADSKSSSQ